MNKKELKLWLRSGSLEFVRNSQHEAIGKAPEAYNWNGNPVTYRPGSSDPEILYQILIRQGKKAEYFVPENIAPRTILDIGGNIGLASLYFARRFPAAKIYSFEPEPENIELQRKNTEPYDNVTCVPVALGADNGKLTLRVPDDFNYGGASLYANEGRSMRDIEVDVRRTADWLQENSIGEVDLIKIDAEGAEFDILTSLPEEVISRVRYIIGELHGVKDYELLGYLSQWFDLGFKKSINKPIYVFEARNKRLGELL